MVIAIKLSLLLHTQVTKLYKHTAIKYSSSTRTIETNAGNYYYLFYYIV